jgi:hypothetical protein
VIQGPPLHVLGQPEHLLGYAPAHAHIRSTADMWVLRVGAPTSVHHVGVVGRGVGGEGLVGDRLVLDDPDVLHENAGHREAVGVDRVVAGLLTRA